MWDRGGTPGFPYTSADGTTAWETFSITSNWALEIPCFTFTGGGFPADQCYSTIQGTSMATPHASAVLALVASAKPNLAHNPAGLVKQLTATARTVKGNTTPALSATDLSNGDSSGVAVHHGLLPPRWTRHPRQGGVRRRHRERRRRGQALTHSVTGRWSRAFGRECTDSQPVPPGSTTGGGMIVSVPAGGSCTIENGP